MFGIGIFDVADCAAGAARHRRDALISLAAEPGGKLDRGVLTDLFFPFGAHLGKVVGEDKGRPRPVGAIDRRDGLVRELHPAVEAGDRRIIPFRNLAEIDIGNHLAVELELAGLDALDVDHRHDPAHDHRELGEAILFKIGGFEWHVRRAEIDRLGGDLLDAAARADRLIIPQSTSCRAVQERWRLRH